MRGPRQESCRISASPDACTGFFLLPRQTPPSPLAFLLPHPEAATAYGDTQAHPKLRPEWELSWALAQSGIASFAFCGPWPRYPELLAAAWRLATQHRLLSRSRIGVVALGPAGEGVMPLLNQLQPLDLKPRTIVVTRRVSPAPLESADKLTSVKGHLIRSPVLGSSATDEPQGHPIAFSEQVIDDLTPCLRRHDDAAAERSIVHPGLITGIVEHLGVALLPSWEQAVRAPGVAIGQAPPGE